MKPKDELKDLFEKTECLMNNMPGLIFIKDTEFNFVECSPDFNNMIKLNKKDIIGLTDYDLPWASYADFYRQRDQETIKDRSISTTLELMPICKHTTLTVKVLKRPFQNSEGKIIGVLGQTTILSSKDELGRLLSVISEIDKKNTTYSEFIPQSYHVKPYNKLKLTQRETECLFLLIRGKNAKEISQFLSLSPRTIESHLENIKGKMNVSSRSELIAKAIESGMLEIIPGDDILVSLYKNFHKWRDFL